MKDHDRFLEIVMKWDAATVDSPAATRVYVMLRGRPSAENPWRGRNFLPGLSASAILAEIKRDPPEDWETDAP